MTWYLSHINIQVSDVYSDPSIGNAIRISVVDILYTGTLYKEQHRRSNEGTVQINSLTWFINIGHYFFTRIWMRNCIVICSNEQVFPRQKCWSGSAHMCCRTPDRSMTLQFFWHGECTTTAFANIVPTLVRTDFSRVILMQILLFIRFYWWMMTNTTFTNHFVEKNI